MSESLKILSTTDAALTEAISFQLLLEDWISFAELSMPIIISHSTSEA